MKTNQLPGFTAQRSLYRSRGSYRAATTPAFGGRGRIGVEPQLKRQLDLLLCLQGCSLAGSGDGCVDTCYRMEHIGASNDQQNPGGGGGPKDPGCRPGCGRCERDPDTGRRVKTCVKANCDTVTRAC